MRTIFGEPSWELASDRVQAYVTRSGGHVGPVSFDGKYEPFSVAPWCGEPGSESLVPILRALRGDFFCMPFGGNQPAFQGEHHPIHGEAANGTWNLLNQEQHRLTLGLRTHIRPGTITKEVSLRPGHAAIYSRHTISEMSGPMSFGHHAMLHFKSEGLISTSPFGFGQVYPDVFEDPQRGGYTSLKQGAMFDSLSEVPRANGGVADLSRYPARNGFEDLVMVYSRKGEEFAWTAVVFPEEGYVWFSLKDPRILTGTVFWISNGGRHYYPWNGRHRQVLGLEEVTSAMHYGLAGSVTENDASRAGYTTYIDMTASEPLVVNMITGIAPIDGEFDHVATLTRTEGGIELISRSGRSVEAAVDHEFLYNS